MTGLDLVDRRRVGDFLVAGADLLVGDLLGDFGVDQCAVQRASAAEVHAALEFRASCPAPPPGRLAGQQPDLDDGRKGRGAAYFRRQPRKLRVEVGQRLFQVGFGDRLAIDRADHSVECGGCGRAGSAAGAASCAYPCRSGEEEALRLQVSDRTGRGVGKASSGKFSGGRYSRGRVGVEKISGIPPCGGLRCSED